MNIMEEEGILAHVRENSPKFRAALERLKDLPIVGDVRGSGLFLGVELVKDRQTLEPAADAEAEADADHAPVREV